MRKTLYPLVFVALAVAVVPTATSSISKTIGVSIAHAGFGPKDVAIALGNSVKWKNIDTRNHRVSCSKCPFTSPVLKPGHSYTHIFAAPGKYAIADPLHSNIKGSVTVKRSKTVTLIASPSVVKYLASTTLSGAVGNGKSGQNVSVFARKCGQRSFSRFKSTTLGTGGLFHVSTTVKLNTAYYAKSNSLTGKAITVDVRPRMRLTKVSRHKFSVKMKVAIRSFVGKRFVVQKKTASGNWVKVKKVVFNAVTTVGGTDVTKAKFVATVRHHRKIRVLLRPKQAAPCYVTSHSNSVRS